MRLLIGHIYALQTVDVPEHHDVDLDGDGHDGEYVNEDGGEDDGDVCDLHQHHHLCSHCCRHHQSIYVISLWKALLSHYFL